MHDICTFDYATIRLVPRVEREEFLNVGVILSCPARNFLEARIEPDWNRLRAFAPQLEPEEVQTYLDIIPTICAGGMDAGTIGKMNPRERFYWLTAQRSTILQTSPVHTGFTRDAEKTLEHLLELMVR